MNYTKIYNDIIDRARLRLLQGYREFYSILQKRDYIEDTIKEYEYAQSL